MIDRGKWKMLVSTMLRTRITLHSDSVQHILLANIPIASLPPRTLLDKPDHHTSCLLARLFEVNYHQVY